MASRSTAPTSSTTSIRSAPACSAITPSRSSTPPPTSSRPTPPGRRRPTRPFAIDDNTGNRAVEGGIYLQDEFKLTPQVTVNYGLRYDRFDANFDDEDQVSPRVNVVWKIDDKTTAHVGYCRYFVPPPVQDLTLADINRFNGTTNAAGTLGDDPPRVERSNYYDVGVSRQVTPSLCSSAWTGSTSRPSNWWTWASSGRP